LNTSMNKVEPNADEELSTALRDLTKLDKPGELNAEAVKRTDARLEKLFARDEQKLAADIAAIKAIPAKSSPRRPAPKPLVIAILAAYLVVVVGVALELSLGSTFIFAENDRYRSVMPTVFWLGCIPFAAGLFAMDMHTKQWKATYPTWVIRWLVMFPLLVALSSVGAMVSPLGWAALFGWAAAVPVQGLDASVISTRESVKKKGLFDCSLKAEIKHNGSAARVCMDGIYIGPAPTAGSKLVLAGRISRFGLFIDSASKPPNTQ
jgi:hypothetical protein